VRRFAVILIAAGAITIGQAIRAQYQVNPQVQTQVRVGLGSTPMTGSVRYAQTSMPMQSEVRYAYAKSGALPSDIRMGYASLGPMTPGGAIDYIPDPPSWTQSKTGPPPSPQGAAAYGVGSVRYAPSTSVNSAPLPVAISPSLVQPSNLAIPKASPLPTQPPKPKPMPSTPKTPSTYASPGATVPPASMGSVRYAP
jgi:hypothetical protein